MPFLIQNAKDVSVKVMAAHPEGGAGSHWGDSYSNALSAVDRKTILAAIDLLVAGGTQDNWRQSRIEYFFLGGALNKYSTQTDIPMLLNADTVDSLRAISMKKLEDDEQVSAFLINTLQQHQTAPPSDSDKSVFMVLFLANQSHDPKVDAALADAMTKAANDPSAPRGYVRLRADAPVRTGNKNGNILSIVPSLKARMTSPATAQDPR